MRPLGNITLDLEPLLCEMVEEHDLQAGEILALIRQYLEVHLPDCFEEYIDGTRPEFYYGVPRRGNKKN